MKALIKRSLLALVIGMMHPAGSFSQCNVNSSICTPGIAGPFNFVTPGPYVSSCLDFWGPNMGYIALNITSSGPLNMLIDGSASTGFLDVAVFNVPAGQAPCTAIQNLSNQIGCNYASSPGGCNQFGTAFPCSSSVPAPYVTAGQTIMIVVENWSGSSNNYTLSLGPAPGAQTGAPNSTINAAGPFCLTSGSTQLTAVNMGGTWSGPGTSSSGMFNPASAGLGTHTITYSIGVAPCNSTSTTTVTVTNSAVAVTPTSATICAGGSTTLTASNAGSYTWSPATGLSATTGATVTASPTTTTTYTVTGTTGSCTSTATVTVTVGGSPTVNPVTSQTVCAGATVAAIPFTGNNGSTVYNWSNSNTATGLGASGSGTIPAFTATNTGSANIVSTVTVTPTLGSCTGTPQTFTITVKPTPTVTAPANVTVCAGATVPASAFVATPATTVINWSNSNTSIGLAGSGAGNTPSFTALNSTASPVTSTVTILPSLNGCSGPTQTYTITVNPMPSMATPTNIAVCAGASVPASTFTTVPAGGTFTWTNSNTGIGLAASGTGNTPVFTGTNSGSTALTGNITVTPAFGTCAGTPVGYSITVNPSPVITPPSNGTYCAGANVPASAYVVTPASATTTWTNSNTAIGLGASGTGNTPAFTAANPGSTSISGTITVNAAAFGCTAPSQTYTITVGPVPTLPQPTAVSACAGTAVPSITFVSTPAGATYNWTNSNTDIGLGASGTGNSPAFTATNSGTAPINGTVTVTPSMGSCVGTPVSFVITINPQPTVTAANDGPVCAGGTINLTATSFAGATYSWSGPNSFSSTLQNPVLAGIQPVSAGTYTVTINSNGCTATSSTTVVVNAGVQPIITQAGPFCANNGVVNLSTNVPGGTWGGPGITNTTNGTFDPSLAAFGPNTITYSVANGCTTEATTTIVVNEVPVVQFSTPDTLGCVALTAELTDESVPASTSVLWDFGDGITSTLPNPAHTYTTAGCYTVTLTSTSNGCSTTSSKQNYICALVRADASFITNNPVASTSDPVFHFINTSQNANTYHWEFGDGGFSNSEDADHTYDNEPANYTVYLFANNDGDCPDSTSLIVSVKEDLIFHVPNAFTPDGDEYNNVFQPVFHSGYDPFSYTLLIYNRWGETIFESHNTDQGWDGTYGGTLQKEGTYTWTIQFKDSESDKKHYRTGSVSLIR